MVCVCVCGAFPSGLSLRRPGFDPGSGKMRYVADTLALRQVYLRILWFSALSINAPHSSSFTAALVEIENNKVRYLAAIIIQLNSSLQREAKSEASVVRVACIVESGLLA